MEYTTFGRHVMVDFWGVDFDTLNDAEQLKRELTIASEKAGATVCDSTCKQFEPQGATAMCLLSESHITIHTYPEKGFCAIDCYTCGDTVDPQIAIDYLIHRLAPRDVHYMKVMRGIGDFEVITERG